MLIPEQDRRPSLSRDADLATAPAAGQNKAKDVNFSTSTLPLDRGVPMSYTGLAFRLQRSAQTNTELHRAGSIL